MKSERVEAPADERSAAGSVYRSRTGGSPRSALLYGRKLNWKQTLKSSKQSSPKLPLPAKISLDTIEASLPASPSGRDFPNAQPSGKLLMAEPASYREKILFEALSPGAISTRVSACTSPPHLGAAQAEARVLLKAPPHVGGDAGIQLWRRRAKGTGFGKE